MANIKMCPICKGRPTIRRSAFGFVWAHGCEENGKGEAVRTAEPVATWGDAVKSWNSYVRKLKDNAEKG